MRLRRTDGQASTWGPRRLHHERYTMITVAAIVTFTAMSFDLDI